MLENSQVLLGPELVAVDFAQLVVRHAESTIGEQILAIPVVGERPRLADQRVDDVPILNLGLLPADQPRQRVHEPIRVPHLDPIGIKAGLDRFADQTTVHRVGVAVDVDQAARIDPTLDAETAVDPLRRQRSHRGQLLVEALATAAVSDRHHLLEEFDVRLAARKIAAAPHQQRLIDRGFEVPVGRLVVPVLVRRPHVGPLARHPVVIEQPSIPRLKFPLRRQVVDRRRQAVAAVPTRDAAEFPHGILEPIRQRFERLRRADRDRFPVRISQNEVVHKVVERLALERDPEPIHAGEIGTRQVAGRVDLSEHHHAARTDRGLPLPHPPLERPPVACGKLTGVLGQQPVEQGLGGQPRLRRQPLGHRRPHFDKRIRPGAIRPRWLRGTRQASRRTILAGGLRVHACPPGGLRQRRSRIQFAKQFANLGIRDHRIPLSRRCELVATTKNAKHEPGEPGILIVGEREI